VLNACFIETCPACGGGSAAGFCVVCAREFTRLGRACKRCGLATPVARCPRERLPWHVAEVRAPFAYRPPLDHYVQALKYRGGRSLGRAFALLLAPELATACKDVDALVAMPLHRTRLLERGYNQAVEIARFLAHELRLPLLARGIGRCTAGATQTEQTAVERRAGVRGVFRVRRDLTGLKLAIVDDVVTTGATVNELAATLRAAGAARCVAFALARTPEREVAAAQPRNV